MIKFLLIAAGGVLAVLYLAVGVVVGLGVHHGRRKDWLVVAFFAVAWLPVAIFIGGDDHDGCY